MNVRLPQLGLCTDTPSQARERRRGVPDDEKTCYWRRLVLLLPLALMSASTTESPAPGFLQVYNQLSRSSFGTCDGRLTMSYAMMAQQADRWFTAKVLSDCSVDVSVVPGVGAPFNPNLYTAIRHEAHWSHEYGAAVHQNAHRVQFDKPVLTCPPSDLVVRAPELETDSPWTASDTGYGGPERCEKYSNAWFAATFAGQNRGMGTTVTYNVNNAQPTCAYSPSRIPDDAWSPWCHPVPAAYDPVSPPTTPVTDIVGRVPPNVASSFDIGSGLV